jgi:pyruvate,water dikinase
MFMEISFSTGIDAFDRVINGVQPGDNIVYQVDSIKDYIPFVHLFCIDAFKNHRRLIYFRFADHEQLLPPNIQAEVYNVDPGLGFESFLNEIFKVIEKFGRGACYVFDLLSELAVDWYSDRMLANFFMLTCPYLYDFETGTYFALLKNHHSQDTVDSIHNTAQVILDVFRHNNQIYIQPLKVFQRHSPTMYMLHVWKNDEFTPLTKSAEIAEIIANETRPMTDLTRKTQDLWMRNFIEIYVRLKNLPPKELELGSNKRLLEYLIRIAVSRENTLIPLILKHLNLDEILKIGHRMVGTGLIGGKAVGMLLAQSILRNSDPVWNERLETHDSFFIGSDVFYTYLVINNCWWVRHKIRTNSNFLEIARDLREKLKHGMFPEDIIEQFKNLLNYFGQSPIIVRSSSLMEDAFHNSFSGKYESIFLANQGDPSQRLNEFIEAVQNVYSSSMNDEALLYRQKKGLLNKDEQMAILVQRVSGIWSHNYFFPQVAGVGYSYNPYVWNSRIDPKAGVLRLVFGLGTRAVDRTDDDYTHIVALNAPNLVLDSEISHIRQYSQKKVDAIDLKKNKFVTVNFEQIVRSTPNLPLDLFATRDLEIEEFMTQRGMGAFFFYTLTFQNLLQNTKFAEEMSDILKILEAAYEYPVDIEFTANFTDLTNFKINVLQCRPFQFRSEQKEIVMPEKVDIENIIFESIGPIIGHGIASKIDNLIYINPKSYGNLSMQDRYQVARTIGKLNRVLHVDQKINDQDERSMTLLLGPGRWGSKDPALGVSVSFSEINMISFLCEIPEMSNLMTDISLGTHFFNDLVECDIRYIVLYGNRIGYRLNKELFNKVWNENLLTKYIPEAEPLQDVILLLHFPSDLSSKGIKIYVDAVKQHAICYLGTP